MRICNFQIIFAQSVGNGDDSSPAPSTLPENKVNNHAGVACGKNVSGDPAHQLETWNFFKKIKDSPQSEGCQKVHETDSNPRPHDQ